MDLPRKELLTSKGVVVLACFTFVYLGKKFGVPSVSVECINDPVHDSLEYFNNLVNTNLGIAQFLQISSSLLMDIVFITLYGYWMMNISTGRLLYATFMFYAVRAATQGLATLRFPDGYYWEDPGVPSIVVPYGMTSDFFYSGHCGFLNLCALEWLRVGRKEYFKVVQIINLYMAIVMLIFRIHYMIDITTAIFMSHYTYILIEQYLDRIDGYMIEKYQQLRVKLNLSNCNVDEGINSARPLLRSQQQGQQQKQQVC